MSAGNTVDRRATQTLLSEMLGNGHVNWNSANGLHIGGERVDAGQVFNLISALAGRR